LLVTLYSITNSLSSLHFVGGKYNLYMSTLNDVIANETYAELCCGNIKKQFIDVSYVLCLHLWKSIAMQLFFFCYFAVIIAYILLLCVGDRKLAITNCLD